MLILTIQQKITNDMKKIYFICLYLCIVLLCGGCSGGSPNEASPSSTVDETAKETPDFSGAPASESTSETTAFLCNFSNLTGRESQETVDAAMNAAGISAQRRDIFFSHVKQFNEAVDATLLYDDFAEADALAPKYDAYDYQDQWMAKYPDFNGYNCRITAFGLFDDYMTVSTNAEIRDNDLFLDKESLHSDKSVLLDESDEKKFLQFFSMVPTENTKDTSVHLQKVQKDWEKRGISFQTNDTLSLITVWFHNQWSEKESELTIGHTGILIKQENHFLFIEKLAFQEPYQATWFDAKEDLAAYLMKKYDVSWGQETAPPFIMENDSLLK